jgi:hypothetical protein
MSLRLAKYINNIIIIIIRKEIFNKSKLKTIVTLLKTLENNEFVYRTRVNIKDNKTNNTITRTLIQFFWAYRK